MKTALIVTDLQRGFLNKHTKHLRPRIKSLLRKQKFDVVIFTRFINHPQSQFEKLIKYTRFQDQGDTGIIPEFKKYAKIVFEKSTYSPFTPQLKLFLNRQGLTHLYFVGVDTNACVLAGVLEAFDQGYTPYVLASCCASHSGPKFHKATLLILEKLIGKQQIIWNDNF